MLLVIAPHQITGRLAILSNHAKWLGLFNIANWIENRELNLNLGDTREAVLFLLTPPPEFLG